ncbi:hypothetical protein QQ045_020550 [Rhodiola kirilowii]
MDVLCDGSPVGGVGIYNPDLQSNWTRQEIELEAAGTSDTARLQLTANNKATIWFGQVSLMPLDTFKGHGFRNDLAEMLVGLKPAFFRFPGGCFVEGTILQNSCRWKNTVGPWEERPGHYGDVWNYWTDDGLGFFEFLQLSDDLGAAPVWVFNSEITCALQDALDGLEFAMGDVSTAWGSDPFDVRYVGVGNEDYNYMIFYNAIKNAYPNINIISNCDMYAPARQMFDLAHGFDQALRLGPKAFVSEYAVTGPDANIGTLLAAVGEAAFLVGLENNSDLVEMASYAPLFTNVNDRMWNPDAIPYNSSHSYGTPSYYMQQFFIESNGATLLTSTLDSGASDFIANAILWNDTKTEFLRIKTVNFESAPVSLAIHVDGIQSGSIGSSATKTELTSANVMDENSLDQPTKIVPMKTDLELISGQDSILVVSPNSITSIDFVVGSV